MVLDNRSPLQPEKRQIGRLVSCTGASAVISVTLSNNDKSTADFWSIGRIISLEQSGKRIVGVVLEMTTLDPLWSEGKDNIVNFKVELTGEVSDQPDGQPVFTRGISSYPTIGALAHRVRAADLGAIYTVANGDAVSIGHLSQDSNIAAMVNVGDMLDKHFAVVGSTGVGKTTAVTLLIRKAIAARPNLRVLILDPHNEYEEAFGSESISLGSDTLDLPFWLFNFEELCAVVFRDGIMPDGERSALLEVIALAKTRFQQARLSLGGGLARRVSTEEGGGVNVDSPMPYRMADVFQIILDAMGKLDPRHGRADLRALKSRLEALCSNYRYRFMFRNTMIEDNIEKVIGNIFRIPHKGRRITVLQMADLPSDVVNSVVAVLGRLALDLAVMSHGGFEISLICEEAHRYIPLDPSRGFGPTRQAISRIAKEGRKFNASIGVVSQRPSELDATIVSQCSTLFAMRLVNEADKAIVRSALAQSSESRIGFLSSLRNREAIAFGEAIAMPMRLFFETVEQYSKVSRVRGSEKMFLNHEMDMRQIILRMRGLEEHGKSTEDEAGSPQPHAGHAAIAPAIAANPASPPAGPGATLRASLYRSDAKLFGRDGAG